jgi:superoxide reductase
MQRREAFKKMGLLSLVGLSGMALVSCGTEEKKIEKTAPLAAATPPKVKSEREKLIINREKNSFKDPANPTKAELKHTPEISFGNKDEKGNILVNITVGMQGIIHPATESHWIDFINVYVNNRLVSETKFANGGIRAYSSFYIALKSGDKVHAETGCNIHGIYSSSVNFE